MEKNKEQNFDAFFEKQLDRVNNWLSFAEAKNAGLVALNAAIIASVLNVFNENRLLCTIVVVISVISCSLCLVSFIPIYTTKSDNRKVNKYNPDKDYNLVFYIDIAEINDVDKYIGLVNSMYFDGNAKIGKRDKDLAIEIVENSIISVHKYKCFKCAVKCDFLALLFLVISVVVA